MTMSELDKLYIAILQSGLAAIRNAAIQGDLEYCKVESEHLHELPSLIGESNMNCHMFYVTNTRKVYMAWASTCGREAVRDMLQYFYSAPWKKMDELLGLKSHDDVLAPSGSP